MVIETPAGIRDRGWKTRPSNTDASWRDARRTKDEA
jgi:hypothetical protein